MKTSNVISRRSVVRLIPLTVLFVLLIHLTVVSVYLVGRSQATKRALNHDVNVQNHLSTPNVIMDDLVWHSPRPRSPRQLGWEDTFITNWKKEHYDLSQRLRCGLDEDSPYKDDRVCYIPGYVPARLSLSPMSQQIPRTIFMSWMTRKLGRSMFTSIKTILLHNPDYELIFFTDEDVDRFLCANFPELSPYFFGLKSGAARTDVWRMLVIERYGGVYLDVDMSALSHLPIGRHDSVVSGLMCWSHVFPRVGGGLEHWALAFRPHHPLIQATIQIIIDNLRDPNNTHVVGQSESEVEDSYIVRLTGPAPYQTALHQLLRQSQCRIEDASYCTALRHPQKYCNFSTFHSLFGNFVLTSLDLNQTITPKLLSNKNELFLPGYTMYNDENVVQYEPPFLDSKATIRNDVCSKATLDKRALEYNQQWLAAIKQKRQPQQNAR
jgi:hypothetical protein